MLIKQWIWGCHMAQTQLKRSQDRKSAAISVPVNAPVVESRAAVPKKETSGKR